jgi:XTP/dITP diphosphohydrolase
LELNNAPGVYSARYAGSQRSEEDNMAKLLNNLENSENRKAQFRTIITLYWNNTFHHFEGKVEGNIALKKTGTQGFGYDPIFLPEGGTRSFGEMNLEEKSELSHRARALQKMIDFLEKISV